jgi:hypothetical protein
VQNATYFLFCRVKVLFQALYVPHTYVTRNSHRHVLPSANLPIRTYSEQVVHTKFTQVLPVCVFSDYAAV